MINIYKFYSENKQNMQNNDKKLSIFSSSHFLNFWFILELVVLLVCPLPHYEYFIEIDYIIKEPNHKIVTIHQPMSDYFLAFMFLRIYFVYKCIFNYSIYTDAYSKKLCKEYGFYPGFRFILKSKFIKYPSQTIFILFLSTILVISYILRIFEVYYSIHPQTDIFSDEQGQYFNILYLVIVTMTTVGFGDLTPHTYPGKIIIMVTAIWGAFMISLVVLTVS